MILPLHGSKSKARRSPTAMTIGHLRISFVAVLLAVLAVALVARASAFSSESEIKPNGDANAMPPAFPQHWGRPPLKQTRDLIELPGGYGRGSGTLRAWGTEKMAGDGGGGGEVAGQRPDGADGRRGQGGGPRGRSQTPARKRADRAPRRDDDDGLPGGSRENHGRRRQGRATTHDRVVTCVS